MAAMPRSALRLFLLCLLLAWPAAAPAQVDACRPGEQQCRSGACCPLGQRCSTDGFCIPPGGEYCGGGRSCPAGQLCVPGSLRCAPQGSVRCGDGRVCTPGTVCTATGCVPRPGTNELIRPQSPQGTGGCLPGGGCAEPGWFLCEETGSQCRPGFKCSAGRGCVPQKAVDCGSGRWCSPGEICSADGCAPSG